MNLLSHKQITEIIKLANLGLQAHDISDRIGLGVTIIKGVLTAHRVKRLGWKGLIP